jgi:phospholipid transport system transporter-binding protein
MTLVEVPALTLKLRDLMSRAQVGTFLVKAGGLQHFDSSALAFLLEGRREGMRQMRSLAVEDAPAKLVVLADLYGVRELLGLNAAKS